MSQTENQVVRGFMVSCPRCGQEDCLDVRLDDVSWLSCRECAETFTRADLERVIRQYIRLLAWLDTAPVYEVGP